MEQLEMKGEWLHLGFQSVEKAHREYLSKFEASELKSALQKYIRRSNVEKAVRVAKEMLLMAPGPLLRRLPAIVAEDCGWKKLWIVRLCHQTGWGSKDLSEETMLNVLRAVAKLASSEKDKDIPALRDRALRGNKEFKELEEDRRIQLFKDALVAKDELMATQLLVHRPTEWIGYQLWDALLAANRGLDSWGGIVDSMRKRVGLGFHFVGDLDCMAIALIQALCREGSWDTEISTQLDVRISEIRGDSEPLLLDWYCFDMHTVIGKISEGILRKKSPTDGRFEKSRMEDIVFFFESALISDMTDQRWFDGWEYNLRVRYGLSVEEAKKEYGSYKDDLKGITEWLMVKKNKK